jgi:membrane-bound lytic murein transglycosylase D
MRLRLAAAITAFMAVCIPWCVVSADDSESPRTATVAAPDSLKPATPVENIRALYQNAWAHRQAGDFATAASLAEEGLKAAGDALGRDPDMPTRRDLTELKSRIAGLRDVIAHDLDAAASAKASGNDADEKVLNAPATDGIEPQINPDVMRWVEFFSGAGRSTFERWLKRSGRYVDLFRAVLQKEGLPPDLVHLVFVESGFNVNARSSSAAVGPWQFLRSTGKLFGLTVNQWLDERKDPEKSTVAAARYLKHLYAIFGDWPLALASYNAGEGTVLRAIKKQGTNNYWDLRLPRQTEDYVPQFMAVLAISRDPGKYGFDSVAVDGPMEFDEIALKGAVDLRAIARLAECSPEELKDLNPAVLRHAASGAAGVTTLRVPRGKGENLMRKLQDGAALPAVDLTLRHVVRRRETLQGIANQYHVSARRLALANGIGKKRPLRRGMTLTIPASMEAPSPAILEAGDPRASTAYVPKRNMRPITSMGAKSAYEGRQTVTVKRGETLAMIAERHGVTVQDIMRWNRLKSPRVRRGTRLKIRAAESTPASSATPTATPTAAASSPPSAVETLAAAAAKVEAAHEDSEQVASVNLEPAPVAHKKASAHAKRSTVGVPKRTVVVVRAGDTLSTIARRHGVSVEALRRTNQLGNDRVKTGQKLKVPAAG